MTTHDLEAVAAKMVYYIEKPEEIERIGKESLALCRNKYEIGIINQRMLEIMQL